MGYLSMPSKEIVANVLNEVDFDDRFFAGRYHEKSGVKKETAYTFKKLVDILNDPLPLINLNRLEEWVRKIMRDKELAKKISETLEQEDVYRRQVNRIKALMEERLNQCEEMGKG